jgi:hypothetical protein
VLKGLLLQSSLACNTQQTMEQGWLHCKDPYLS